MDVIFDFMREHTLLFFVYFILGMIAINTVSLIGHKISFAHYNKTRLKLYSKKRKEFKVEKTLNDLNVNSNYFSLKSKQQKKLKAYYNFLLKDLKYNVYCQNRHFSYFKKVTATVSVFGELGQAKGDPKKVFNKLAKNSKNRKSFVQFIELFEEVAYRRSIYGLKDSSNTISLSYVLSWTE